MNTIYLLFLAHYVADFALQNDWTAKNKAPGMPFWIHVMTAHCASQSLGVYLATGSVVLGMFEFVAHFCIDSAKCMGMIGFTTDQLLHLACKLLWFGLLYGGIQ